MSEQMLRAKQQVQLDQLLCLSFWIPENCYRHHLF